MTPLLTDVFVVVLVGPAHSDREDVFAASTYAEAETGPVLAPSGRQWLSIERRRYMPAGAEAVLRDLGA